jgi:hypothetical protein
LVVAAGVLLRRDAVSVAGAIIVVIDVTAAVLATPVRCCAGRRPPRWSQLQLRVSLPLLLLRCLACSVLFGGHCDSHFSRCHSLRHSRAR